MQKLLFTSQFKMILLKHLLEMPSNYYRGNDFEEEKILSRWYNKT